MKSPRRFWSLLIIFFFLSLINFQPSHSRRDTLFQVSTLSALEQGNYDGKISLQALKRFGDFGIGTFEGMAGEMIVLDHKIYQIPAQGEVHLAGASIKTPFAMITHFENEQSFSLEQEMTLQQLSQALDQRLKSKNIIYAIRMEGEFKSVKARSVSKQTKPYPPISEVVKNQTVFEFKNQKGTLAGFWFPSQFNAITFPAYHFHFLTQDRKAGGHLLDCQAKNLRVSIDATDQFHLILPEF